eukprot:13990918-Heterocapsa_arctica.AAC.1
MPKGVPHRAGPWRTGVCPQGTKEGQHRIQRGVESFHARSPTGDSPPPGSASIEREGDCLRSRSIAATLAHSAAMGPGNAGNRLAHDGKQ